jgi:hypothetical protein
MNDVKSDIFPRKNSFLSIPIHPTLSTFLSFWIILGTIAAITSIANRALNTIIFSINTPSLASLLLSIVLVPVKQIIHLGLL